MADPVELASPCTGVCRMDERSGLCVGCARTLAEIAAWSTLSNEDKRHVCAALALRQAKTAPAALQDPAPRP
ncbi:MAG: DUF1289 domain-containing protein [Burkholderiales bacterium]|nr:DUF1289 domain-containing protein [Burkholderiales bacterium]MDE2628867.1 DUF1289 domain-containing protein [Burkholderiales bacterium]